MSVTNLSQAIFDQVSERVLHWRYLPGERLHRESLCAEFKVSRSPVREALQMLADRRLIEKTPRQGYVVRQLNLTEIHELYDLRLGGGGGGRASSLKRSLCEEFKVSRSPGARGATEMLADAAPD